jgi:outer membrane biogenesis lipoprotein LolB
VHQQRHRPSAVSLLLTALAILLLGACSSPGSATPAPASTSLAARPASTAKLTILAPRNGQTISRKPPRSAWA